jgi:multicomponent Na+:H+ antiporter subunit E
MLGGVFTGTGGKMTAAEWARRIVRLAAWAYAVWILLTWTATPESLTVGAGVALACGFAFAPLGEVAAPWTALRPRRIGALTRLAGTCAVRIVHANLSLSRRILLPSRPLRSGMIIAPTEATSDGELAATGVLTSLVVDNQLVDLDRSERVLQYHAVAVPSGSVRDTVNGPIEARVIAVTRLQ